MNEGSTCLMAFWKDSSKLRPMAITSPTDFIEEPMSLLTCWNFDRSHLGILPIGLQSILHITFSNNTKVTDNLDGSRSEHVVLLVRKRLRRSNHNRVSSVDSQWVEILHITDGDAVSDSVSDHLVLDLFPSFQRLLHKNLRSKRKRLRSKISQFGLIGSKTRSKTSQSVGRSDNNRIPNLVRSSKRIVNSFNSNGLGNWDIDLIQRLSKQVSVLRGLQSFDWSPKNLDTIFFENTHFFQLNTNVQTSLASKCEQHSIRSFPFNDIRNVLGSDWKIVDLVGKGMRSLVGSNIRVNQDRLLVGLLQGLDGLGTGIVKLSCLANRQSSRANH
ncbi:hypothetical protein OGATHE_005028 [Ogataea polymorpha]|uniref:Uncharacterized protein n=1 Tax=Ogataea polymorpha TaxID=460523 RepID=A0A9P8T0K1_9ASCO|nr:hypothetical protein OGATHE_005028 [Ogataea polymorpha]